MFAEPVRHVPSLRAGVLIIDCDTPYTVPKFQGDNFYKNKKIVDEFQKLARRKGCTSPQVALAWVAAQGMVAIPGTTKPKRLEENWGSRTVKLSEDEKVEVRSIIEQAKPQGLRYGEKHMAMVGH